MNDRFTAFEVDSFGGNGFHSGTPIVGIQQPQQRYNIANSGPCMDDYDPTRLLDHTSPYNSTGGPTGRSNSIRTHQTLMPSNVSVAPSLAGGLQMQGLEDFEPIPLSNKALRQLKPGQSVTHSKNNVISRPVMDRTLPRPHLSDLHPSSNSGSIQYTNQDAWLDDLKLTVSGVSLEPLSGTEIVERLRTRTQEVGSRYLPCVEFLVQCQQELRKGLALATKKTLVHHMFRDNMSPQQFFKRYIECLPARFYQKNQRKMKSDNLSEACKELEKLCDDACAVQSQGCEVVKNTFLGGMKDGESWGLRKWLSKHGGALHICNDCECILHSCQKLDRSKDSTRKLSEKLRPLAKKALRKLKSDVPSSYQEQSTAHPYLPFFHRLESALRGMSTFDPDDDDVICIDDDEEVEVMKAKAAAMPPKASKSRKRKTPGSRHSGSASKLPIQPNLKKPFHNEDSDSEIEILEIKPAGSKKTCTPGNGSNDDADSYMRALLNTFDDDSSSDIFADLGQNPFSMLSPRGDSTNAFDLACGLDRLAVMFDQRQEMLVRPSTVYVSSFWDESKQYSCALRLFSELLRTPDSGLYLERPDDNRYPQYSRVIKHPLCFRDIVNSLMEESDDMDKHVTGSDSGGVLPVQGLSSWNMWRGNDLLQAIDLVFLNSLAYGKFTNNAISNSRSKTNKLRKLFWSGIKNVIDSHIGMSDAEQRRRCTPTRRGESSGFVVHKN